LVGNYKCLGEIIMIIELKTSMAEMCWPECNIYNHFVHGLQIIGRDENHLFIGTVSLSYLLTDRLNPPPYPISTQSWAHQNFPEPFGFLFRPPAIPCPFVPQENPAASSSVPTTASAPSQVSSPSSSSSPPPPPR
jgi:hypothetical protein